MAKFDDNEWKLMKASGVRLIGDTMDGEMRSCIPPESVTETTLPSVESPRSTCVSFLDEDVKRHNNIYSDSLEDPIQLTFIPNKCIADTSWDAWSFGLAMGQMLLGSSAMLLPNFDRDTKIHMKRLFHFDSKALEVSLILSTVMICFLSSRFRSKLNLFIKRIIKAIKVTIEKNAGHHASDLIGRLLEPIPSRRLKSMNDILLHGYFTEEVGHFAT